MRFSSIQHNHFYYTVPNETMKLHNKIEGYGRPDFNNKYLITVTCTLFGTEVIQSIVVSKQVSDSTNYCHVML